MSTLKKRPVRAVRTALARQALEQLPAKWTDYLDRCRLRVVHAPDVPRPFQLWSVDHTGIPRSSHASMKALKRRLSEEARWDLWIHRVVHADVQYALDTGDDACVRAIIEGRAFNQLEAPFHTSHAAHMRHCDEADGACKRLNAEQLKLAAQVLGKIQRNTLDAAYRHQWKLALAERSAAALEGAIAAVPQAQRRRL
ncbi:hypothetical protein [Luteibacter sp. 9133]|uniref:hypothetical protein n=1 Tax=Luteibacter sp. 9133 TaxID=1500891 RepID=UPI0005BA9A75|nr:hypothetical protein [Luteibacter sp. 9133]